MIAYPQERRDPTAVMGRRILAYLLDGLLLSAVFWILFFITASSQPGQLGQTVEFKWDNQFFYVAMQQGDQVKEIHGGTLTAVLLCLTVYAVLALVVMQGLAGITPGKAVTGLRAVNRLGQPCGILRALVRELMWVVDAFPWFVPLVAPIVAFATPHHRRVGDFVAGTYVIDRGSMGVPVVGEAAPAVAVAGPAQTGPRWDPARGTYLQWDQGRSVWLEWDREAEQWKPVDG